MFWKYHTQLLLAMNLQGYSFHPDGICHGFSCLWIQAILLGEEDVFIKRMNKIWRICTFTWTDEQRRHLLNKDPDIRAFFENISLAQTPQHYQPTIQLPLGYQQDIVRTYSFTKSLAHENESLELERVTRVASNFSRESLGAVENSHWQPQESARQSYH